MPRFFVPLCETDEQAANLYASFVETASYPLTKPGSRLFRVSFKRGELTVVAEVGAPLLGWEDPIGPVLAIIEATRMMYVHVLPSPRAATAFPILISPDQVLERVYFDDYPLRGG